MEGRKKEKENKKGNGVAEEISKVNGGTGKGTYQQIIACAGHGSFSSTLHMKWHHLSPPPHQVSSGNLRNWGDVQCEAAILVWSNLIKVNKEIVKSEKNDFGCSELQFCWRSKTEYFVRQLFCSFMPCLVWFCYIRSHWQRMKCKQLAKNFINIL